MIKIYALDLILLEIYSMKALIALALTLISQTASAADFDQRIYLEKFYTEFYKSGVSLDVGANATTVLTVQDVRFSKVANIVFIRYSVETVLDHFNTMISPGPGFEVPLTRIVIKVGVGVAMDGQTFTVTSANGPGGQGPLEAASVYESRKTLREDVKKSIYATLLNRGNANGVGIEFNTEFARYMEKAIPGIQKAFVEHLTEQVYTSRLEDFAEELADMVVSPTKLQKRRLP
ncbi:hypothetical protein K2X30_14570 [bacterium]|nr:hypothetical protein [bacterium]